MQKREGNMSKAKKLITDPRIIVLLIFLVIAILFIHPNPYNSGVAIRSIDKGSPAALAGFESPAPSASLMGREKIISINTAPVKIPENENATLRSSMSVGRGSLRSSYQSDLFGRKKNIPEGMPIKNVDDYYDATSNISPNQTIIIVTNKGKYELIIDRPGNESKSFGTEDIGLNVYEVPKNNLRKGLDLQGGTRVLLQPERKLREEETQLVIDILKQRLNIYGLSDIVIKEAGDLSGNQFILVEVAGANKKEVQELIAKQGKFEAKIGNETVFTGGRDITYVCRGARCAGIDPRAGCHQQESDWFCRFRFSITLSQEAAQNQADVTKDLDIVIENNSAGYLSKKLELYLDDELVDELNIGVDLKDRPVTGISISGSGNGTTRQEATVNAFENMKRLQTVLLTGSLPVKLEIVKIDSLSPLLGERFAKNSLKVGLLALLTVSLIVFARYRKVQVAIPMVLSMLSEVVIILGVAALIKWNLDLAAIAGIILSVGTGVDDLIVMSDESLGEDNKGLSWKEKRKNTFFIIMAAYFTTIVAMVPLVFAGAGLLRGFALTTMLGISAGVFIVRPAFAATIKILFQD
jgi:preprotein translocase subunit SecD